MVNESEFKKMQEALRKKERELKNLKEDLERRERMFQMQWSLLEHELSLFAKEREAFEKEKNKMKYKAMLEKEKNKFKSQNKISAGMYFLGVRDELSLIKRYRDLLKLYHPDNMNGDVNAMQAINKEYHELRKKMSEV